MKWSEVKVTQSCPTLWDPMDYTVRGILQARIREWVAFPFSRGSSQPKDRTQVSCIASRFFTSWATREAQEYWSGQPISSPGDHPNPGIKPGSPALQADSLPAELLGKSAICRSLLRFISTGLVMLSNHLILCCPFLLLRSIFPIIRVFSNELTLCIMWPKYWRFSFSISPSNEYSGLISFRIDCLTSLAVLIVKILIFSFSGWEIATTLSP